jgi:hypothetical protein
MQWSKLNSKKPMDQTWEDDKLWGPSQKSVESCGTRIYVQLGEKPMTRAHMQKGAGSRRLRNWHHAKKVADWAEVGPSRLAQSTRTIYSPETKSHTSFVISHRGAEKRGTPSQRGEGRASWLGSPYPTWEPCKEDHVEVPELEARSR